MDPYRPWAYANERAVREERARRFRQAALEAGLPVPDAIAAPAAPPQGYGSSKASELDNKKERDPFWKQAIKASIMYPLMPFMQASEQGQKYIGDPLFGVALGSLDAPRDQYGRRTGRKGMSNEDQLKSIWKGFKEGLQHPLAAGEAWKEVRTNQPKYVAAALGTASDPLTYAGGPLAKVIPGTNVVAKASRALLDQGGAAMAFGGSFGATAGQDLAQRAGWGETGQLVAALGGGIAGGSAGAGLRVGARSALRGINTDAIRGAWDRTMAAEAPVMGATEPRKPNAGQQSPAGGFSGAGDGMAEPAPGAPVNQNTRGVGGRRLIRAIKNETLGDRTVGLPPQIKTEAELDDLLQRVEKYADAGAPYRNWYENSSAALRSMANGDPHTGTVATILTAWGSTDTSVKGQAGFLSRAMAQWANGEPITAAHRYSAVSKRAAEMVDLFETDPAGFVDKLAGMVSGEASGANTNAPKIGNFFVDLLDDVNPDMATAIREKAGVGATVDRWIARAYGYPGDVVSPQARLFIQEDIRRLANARGWKPKQVQAAIWVGKMAEDQGAALADSGFDYADSLSRHVAQVSWETMPAEDSQMAQVLLGIEQAAPEVQAELHYRLGHVGLDSNGYDILAREMKLPTLGQFEGPGVEKLDTGTNIHPGSQTLVPVAPIDSKTFLSSPEVKKLIDGYAALTSFWRDQRAAPWTRPFADAPKFMHNGMLVELGGIISPEQAGAVAASLSDDFVVLPHPRGALIFAIPSEAEIAARQGVIARSEQQLLAAANRDRLRMIQEALDVVYENDPNVTPEYSTLATDGNYVTREDGEALLNEIGGQGAPAWLTPNLRETVLELQRRSRLTAEDFAREYKFGPYGNADGTPGSGGPSSGVSPDGSAFDYGTNASGLASNGRASTWDVIRQSYGASSPMRALVQTGAAAAYGYANPEEDQSRTEGALSAGALAIARSVGLNPALIRNAARAYRASAAEGSVPRNAARVAGKEAGDAAAEAERQRALEVMRGLRLKNPIRKPRSEPYSGSRRLTLEGRQVYNSDELQLARKQRFEWANDLTTNSAREAVLKRYDTYIARLERNAARLERFSRKKEGELTDAEIRAVLEDTRNRLDEARTEWNTHSAYGRPVSAAKASNKITMWENRIARLEERLASRLDSSGPNIPPGAMGMMSEQEARDIFGVLKRGKPKPERGGMYSGKPKSTLEAWQEKTSIGLEWANYHIKKLEALPEANSPQIRSEIDWYKRNAARLQKNLDRMNRLEARREEANIRTPEQRREALRQTEEEIARVEGHIAQADAHPQDFVSGTRSVSGRGRLAALKARAARLAAGLMDGEGGSSFRLTQEEAGAAGRNWKPPLEGDDRAVLGLESSRDYTPEEVRAAYRSRMREYHPDVNASDTATADTQRINAAFEKLSGGARATTGSAAGAEAGAGASAGAGPSAGPRTSSTGGAWSESSRARAGEGWGSRASENAWGERPGSGATGGAGGAGAGAPPPGATGPKSGRPRTERPERDLFGTVSASTMRRQAAEYLNTTRGRIDQGIRRAFAATPLGNLDKNLVKDSTVTPFVVKARNAIKNRIDSYEGYADHIWGRIEDSGIKITMDDSGQWRMEDGTLFEDMVELKTPEGRRTYAGLTDAQQTAIDDLVEFNLRLNDNLRYHGKGLEIDPEVEAAYFPRFVKGKNGEQKAWVGGDSGAGLGTSGSFMKDRVFETLQEGLDSGMDYAHPREAWRAMVRSKLRVAGDAYVSDALAGLGKTESELRAMGGHAGFNYVSLPQGLAPSLNGRYFPREVAERIVAGLAPRQKGVVEKVIGGVNTALTPARAIADISWLMQQGGAFMYRHPLRAKAGTIAVLKSSLGDPAAYRGLLDKALTEGGAKMGMNKDDYLQFLISKGFALSADDLGADVIAFKGLKGGTNIAGLKQGRQAYQAVGRFSNETFARYLNYAGVEFANDAVERALASGKMDQLEGALAAVNRMQGRTGRNPSQLESLASFAPRFLSAAVEQTFAAVSKGGLEGSIARRHIGRMLATGAVVTTAINELRGYDTEYDPRSPNFLRIRNMGGLDVSLFGTYDTFFRALAGTVAGEAGKPIHPDIKRLWKFAEGKMSPAVAAVYYPFIKQSTYNGEPLDPLGGWSQAGKAAYNQGKSMLPFGAQSFIEEGVQPAIQEKSLAPLAQGLVSELASGTGMTNSPVTPTEFRDWERNKVGRQQFGASYSDLSGAQKSMVNEDRKVAGFQAKADKNTLTREDERSQVLRVTQQAQTQIEALSQELESGQISGNDFRDQLHSINDQLRGARSVLEKKGGSSLKGWFDLYDQAQMPDGRIDYDKLEMLQADYREKHPNVDDELNKAIGANDNATMREYREAQKLAKAYYAIPAYRGMTLEQSKKATEALASARAQVSFGQARSVRAALYKLMQSDPETARLALRASRAQSNPERKKFRKDNPLFAKFYSDITLTSSG